jgi:DNA-binding transcriptional ArsR family regulator
VTTVAELKALADPLRLAILDALVGGATRELRVLSVKELAAELGEPKTKLYRHIKLLEAAGLIRVAATRLVSGIVEHRYQARQVDLFIGPMREAGGADEANILVDFTLDRYRRRYLDYLASLPPDPPDEGRSYLTSMARMVSPVRARIIQDKLREAAAEFDGPAQPGDDAADAVQIEALVSYMTTE